MKNPFGQVSHKTVTARFYIMYQRGTYSPVGGVVNGKFGTPLPLLPLVFFVDSQKTPNFGRLLS
jgi:hypothetical protein